MTTHKPIPTLSTQQEYAFWERVAVDMYDTDACWPWKGAKKDGYGVTVLHPSRKSYRAHRIAYTLSRGPIADGLTLDHVCRNRSCCNPAHLDPVTAVENTKRRVPFHPRISHCKWGHELTAANTRMRRGRRECLDCIRATRKAKKAWRSGKRK